MGARKFIEKFNEISRLTNVRGGAIGHNFRLNLRLDLNSSNPQDLVYTRIRITQ